jgi:hypothetical protein
VVIGCWVTQKWDPRRPGELDAKPDGVDEEDIIRHCETYLMIGNDQVPQNKRIWARPHHIEYPPYVYSRALNGSREFIATWRGGRARSWAAQTEADDDL